MQQTGGVNVHRYTLAERHDADVLDKFITSINITGSIVAVEISYIIKKAVYIKISSEEYLSPLSNSFEYH